MSDLPQAATDDTQDPCPICGREMEDARHVTVECFYDVSEVVPNAKRRTLFAEVAEKAAVWGVTRTYGPGTRDRYEVAEGKGAETTVGGLSVLHLARVPEPVPPVRLVELTGYAVSCCKPCRADFLRMAGMWARGELVHREERREGEVVPIRELGALRYVTEEEARNRRRDDSGEPTRVGSRDDPDRGG